MSKPLSIIKGYHAHVYYDVETKDAAEHLRGQLGQKFAVKLGKWYDEPVGPHSQAMYQVAFPAAEFNKLVPWLMLNREGLSILVHPQTGDDLADHSDHALWLGNQLDLALDKL